MYHFSVVRQSGLSLFNTVRPEQIVPRTENMIEFYKNDDYTIDGWQMDRRYQR